MRLKFLESFACYYGRNHLAALQGYDLTILQAAQYTSKELAILNSRGVTVVAYLSIGEVPVAEGGAGWILRNPTSGEPFINAQWGTVAVDCRSEQWHRHLLEERIPELLIQGATGLFLDTVDVQESHSSIRPGVVALLRKIRQRFPDAVIVVNRGFAILDTVLSIADAVVFEAFSSHYDGVTYDLWRNQDLAWTAEMAARLNQTRGPCPVLTIDYAGPEDHDLRQKATDRARRYGFIPYVSTYALDWLPETR